MSDGYEELFKSLIEKEMTAPDESVQDTKRNAIASLIPMAAGVLTGQVSQGAQLGISTYKTLEDQRSKSRGKLLDYLAKMKTKQPTDKIITKDIMIDGDPETIAFRQSDLLKGAPVPIHLGQAGVKDEKLTYTSEGIKPKSDVLKALKKGEKVLPPARSMIDPTTGYIIPLSPSGQPATSQQQGDLNPKQRDAAVTARKDLLADQQYDKVSQAISASDEAEAMLDSGSGIAATALGTKIARAMGEVGNLAVAEQIIYKTRPDLASKAKELFANLVRGDKAEINKEDLRTLLRAMREANAQTLSNIVGKHSRMYSNTYGVPESKAMSLFSELSNVPKVKVESGLMTPEKKKARLEELRKKYKGN